MNNNTKTETDRGGSTALPLRSDAARMQRIATQLSDVSRIDLAVRSCRRARAEIDTRFAAPRTETEQTLVRICEDVLGIQPIGVHDPFFALGGDSLAITRVASKIVEQFDVLLPMQTFFRSPTVAGLAEEISQRLESDEQLKELLDEVEQLTAEETRERLQQNARSASARVETAGACYRCGAIDSFSAGDRLDFVYAASDHSGVLLPSDAVELLRSCQSSKTLDEHLHDVLSRGSAHALSAVGARFNELSERGLLVPDRGVDTGAREGRPMAAAEIRAIVCPTQDRLRVLERCLASYMANCARYGRTPDFIVATNSLDDGGRDALRQIAASLHGRYGFPLFFAGFPEKREFAHKLHRAASVPLEIAEIAICGAGVPGMSFVGANRNTLLLETAGQMMLSVDDDTICRIVAAPGMRDDVAHTGNQVNRGCEPSELWSFPDCHDGLRSARFIDEDILALHEQFLGKPAREPSATHEHAEAESCVHVTLNGLLGDCGWGAPSEYLELTGPSFERITFSESEYRAATCRRHVLRVPCRPTIARRCDNLMSTFFGADNRTLLPPFGLAGRGTDRLFAITLAACNPRSRFAHLPSALLHIPADARRFWSGEVVRSAAGIDFSLLLCLLTQASAAEIRNVAPEAAMRRIGNDLAEIGRRHEDAFSEQVTTVVHAWATDRIDALNGLLSASGGSPEFWAADVRAYIERLRASVFSPAGCIPLDVLYGRGEAEARKTTQRLVGSHGMLLECWPTMIDAARSLRCEGVRLAQPLN